MSLKTTDHTERDLAVDPNRSVIVQAPAGSGKTSLLVNRYLKLLALVERPEEILAITFTRKAASEMRHRVLQALLNRTPNALEAINRDKALGWRLIEQPNCLRIQTIDSFAYSLISQLPVGSGLSNDATLLEDAQNLYKIAIDKLFRRLENDPFSSTLAKFLALLDNDYVKARSLLGVMLDRREQWIDSVIAIVGSVLDPEDHIKSVVKAVESGINNLNRSMIDRILLILPQDTIKELDALCAFATKQQSLDYNEPLNGKKINAWRIAANLVTTKRGTARRRLNVNDGFPRNAAAEKSRAVSIIEILSNQGVIPLFAEVALAPNDSVSINEREGIECFAVTLSLLSLELETVFTEHQALDFPAITLGARRSLQHEDIPTELALSMDNRISHVLVDEFQDTSIGQYHLLERLLETWNEENSNSFFAVGDPMQSIYRFRNADVRLYQQTLNQGIGQIRPQAIQLTTNFRSQPEIVNWCNELFMQLFTTNSNPLVGQVPYQASIPVETVESSSESKIQECKQRVGIFVCVKDTDGAIQSQTIVKRIFDLRRNDPSGSICVLVRSRNVLSDIFTAMRKANIVWRGTDVEPLVDTPIVRDLYSITLALNDRTNRLAWLAVLRSPLFGLSLLDLEVAATKLNIHEMLGATGYSVNGKKRIGRLSDALDLDFDNKSLRHVVETFWLKLGGADAYGDSTSLDDADRFFSLLDEYDISEFGNQFLEESLQRLFASATTLQHDVEVMTIHKAKGLEFDHVIIPGLERSTRPRGHDLLLSRPEGDHLLLATAMERGTGSLYNWLLREEGIKDRNELKRLLYVAATRAKKSLTLTASVDDIDDPAPPQNSILAMIWEQIKDQIEFVETTHRLNPDSGLPPRIWERLPVDYAWKPPVRLPRIRSERNPNDLHHDDLVGDRTNSLLGEIVHLEMKLMSDDLPRDPSKYIEKRLQTWELILKKSGCEQSLRTRLLNIITWQIRAVLTDDKGLWLLNSEHSQAESEAPYTGLINGQFQDVVIDRTFIEGTSRWIVDYKTSVPDEREDEAEFIRKQIQQHTPQLLKYSKILAAQGISIRTALYLTALPKLVEIDLAC